MKAIINEFLNSFETRNRSNGESFYCLKDDAAQEFMDIIRTVHDDELPNDYIYEVIYDSLVAMSESENDDLQDATDYLPEQCYNSYLFGWLNGLNSATGYIDDHVEQCGYDSFYLALYGGYRMFQEQIFFALLSELQK